MQQPLGPDLTSQTPFEAECIRKFDDLVDKGLVVWKENQPTYHRFGPITFEFRVSPTLRKKPIYPPYNSLHEEQEAIDASKPPFSDPENDPTKVTSIGDHTLVINKYSFLRPQFVLHTTKFQPQEELMTIADFCALDELLLRLGRDRYIGFFNCGGAAGASVNHKHLQVVPRPDRTKMALWPDETANAKRATNVALRDDRIPFRHEIWPITSADSPDTLHRHYSSMCNELMREENKPHSFVMCGEWMVVIPRSKPRVGNMGSNAMGMLGMQWCGSEESKQQWLNADPFKVIAELAFSR